MGGQQKTIMREGITKSKAVHPIFCHKALLLLIHNTSYAERSFSALKSLQCHSYDSTIMMLTYVHKDQTDDLNLEEIARM